MDENLEYLLHDELEGLFAAPAAARAGGRAAPPPTPPRPKPAAAPSVAAEQGEIARLLAQRLHDPKLLEALLRLLEAR
ncbi:hypothetical protein [Lysobacter enzymogenes]|uniref:Uncharacterized protein n=1 Tax=Lysobacter enzymogenes TaxID=69 RepID=A0AAU9AGN2_LYSEN|nr:hypothetical protein [Lysobacter enzymogenes]BAV96078.1 hypothetical protein LEN_0591 [Lysobacter enzymogenes]